MAKPGRPPDVTLAFKFDRLPAGKNQPRGARQFRGVDKTLAFVSETLHSSLRVGSMVFVSVCYCVLWPQSHLVFWTVFGWPLLLYGFPLCIFNMFTYAIRAFVVLSSLTDCRQLKTSKQGQDNSEMLKTSRGADRPFAFCK